MKNFYYILDEDKNVIPVDDVLTWGKFFQSDDRIVRQTDLPNGVNISTVFLGIDHSLGFGKSEFFETMIFGGDHDGYQERYDTWDEALQGHQRAIAISFEIVNNNFDLK